MQSKDEIKEELGWLKVIFGVLIVTGLSIVGWTIQKNEYLALAVILIFSGTLALVVRDAFKYARGDRKALVR
jgi:drug/metabolite transporter (DMT)-like permease